jgi:hypothetical protein
MRVVHAVGIRLLFPGTTSVAHPAPILVAAAANRPARTPAWVRRHRAARTRPARIRRAPAGTPGPVFAPPVPRRLRRGRVGRRAVWRRRASAASATTR